MGRARQILMDLVPAAIGPLAVLSVVGAFLGAERAGALFRSLPLTVYWFLLAGLLLAGLIAFGVLRRSPGLAAMHAGALLVLAGAMWGSDAAHALRAAWLGDAKVPSGYMILDRGDLSDTVLDDSLRRVRGTLPFRIGLGDFRVEYYESNEPWWLAMEQAAPKECSPGRILLRTVEWTEGKAVQVEGTALWLRVFRYLPRARPLRNERGEVIAAEPAPDGRTPAIEVEVTLEGRTQRGWIMPEEGGAYGSLSLAPLAGPPPTMPPGAALRLYLLRPTPMPKDYLSDLVIVEDGKPVARKTVEVNHPLHWAGYHIYQHAYDDAADGRRRTILSVVSDSGWSWGRWPGLVPLGFLLLATGTFWRFWVESMGTMRTARSHHGD